MKKIWFVIVLCLTKFLLLICKILKINVTRGIGLVAVKLQKDFISHFYNIDYKKTIFITGTNGKSTTNSIIVSIFNNTGKKIVTNINDDDSIYGVATSLIKNASLSGKINTDFLIFEIDELSLSDMYKYLPGKNICITNILKGSIGSYAYPDIIFNKIKNIITKDVTLFLNNEDARSKALEDYSDNVIYYSVSKTIKSYTKTDIYDVTLACPKCNCKIDFDYYNENDIGNFKCTNCDFKSENKPNYQITRIDEDNNEFLLNKDKYYIHNNNTYIMYSYSLALSVCKFFGITKKQINDSLKLIENTFIDNKIINYKSKKINTLIIKKGDMNTLKFAFDYINKDKKEKVLLIGIEKDDDNNFINTFYTYDCDLSTINDSNIIKCICFSKVLSYDIANRLIYAGYNKDNIEILPTNNNISLLKKIEKIDSDNIYLITYSHKYKKLLSYISLIEKDDNNG